MPPTPRDANFIEILGGLKPQSRQRGHYQCWNRFFAPESKNAKLFARSSRVKEGKYGHFWFIKDYFSKKHTFEVLS